MTESPGLPRRPTLAVRSHSPTSQSRTHARASRALVGLEHAMRLTDEVTPFNVVSVLRLEGALSPASLRAALDELQRRHPFLRARIVPAGRTFLFHFDGTTPIPLEVGERPAGTDGWVAAAEEELHRPFDHTVGPPARCRYLAGPSGGDLIVTCPHVIIDATAGPRLFAELLALAAGEAPPDPGLTAEEGRLPPPALFPEAFHGVRLAPAVAGFVGRQMADEMRFRWRSRGVRAAPIAGTGGCHILPLRWPAPLAEAIVRASRRERVTLNAILSAGMLAAVERRLYRSPRTPLRHIVFADLRPRLRAAVPESMLGCFLTMFRFTIVVERERGFWALARDVQDATRRSAHGGERYLAFLMAPRMMKVILGLRRFRMSATALSYNGAPGLPTRYGALELTELHAFPTNFTLGPEYSAVARLFRGELHWDILYLDSDMDEAGARAIADDMRAIVEEATC